MPLESLHDENINIHDLTIEEEKKQPESEALKIFEKLKKTDLYDKKYKQWNRQIDEYQKLETMRYAEAQLLGVLVESKFDEKSAQQLYKDLKKTDLHDSENNQWFNWMNKSQGGLKDHNFEANDQLLGILVESKFDKTSAWKSYEKLKKSKLYDQKRKQWYNELYRPDDIPNSYYHADTRLLSILIESQFDKTSAKKMFDELKETQLYDSWRKQWNTNINRNSGWLPSHVSRDAGNQLLGVLVEAQFDKPSAQELYNDLKQTPLYDKEKQQWNSSMDENQELGRLRMVSINQLLGILCEKKFEEKDTDLNDSTSPPLPEERNY